MISSRVHSEVDRIMRGDHAAVAPSWFVPAYATGIVHLLRTDDDWPNRLSGHIRAFVVPRRAERGAAGEGEEEGEASRMRH